MSPEPEKLVLRMLRDMREEHAVSLDAMNAQMRAVRRFYEKTETILDRLHAMDANILAVRADMQSFHDAPAPARQDGGAPARKVRQRFRSTVSGGDHGRSPGRRPGTA